MTEIVGMYGNGINGESAGNINLDDISSGINVLKSGFKHIKRNAGIYLGVGLASLLASCEMPKLFDSTDMTVPEKLIERTEIYVSTDEKVGISPGSLYTVKLIDMESHLWGYDSSFFGSDAVRIIDFEEYGGYMLTVEKQGTNPKEFVQIIENNTDLENRLKLVKRFNIDESKFSRYEGDTTTAFFLSFYRSETINDTLLKLLTTDRELAEDWLSGVYEVAIWLHKFENQNDVMKTAEFNQQKIDKNSDNKYTVKIIDLKQPAELFKYEQGFGGGSYVKDIKEDGSNIEDVGCTIMTIEKEGSTPKQFIDFRDGASAHAAVVWFEGIPAISGTTSFQYLKDGTIDLVRDESNPGDDTYLNMLRRNIESANSLMEKYVNLANKNDSWQIVSSQAERTAIKKSYNPEWDN
ncbi:MAG: hypothetical protein ACP5N3_05285 [Candidatus Nanoarchaeia archaeon]